MIRTSDRLPSIAFFTNSWLALLWAKAAGAGASSTAASAAHMNRDGRMADLWIG